MATVNGGAGDETITGTADNDSISGGGGHDSLTGSGGNDTLSGDAGADTIEGGTGDDVIQGGTEDDSLSGGDGYDKIYGGEGNDTIEGGGYFDDLYGGDGNDSISGGDDDDWIWGEDGDDTISGDSGQDWLFGGAGADSIHGGADNDTLLGDAGNDSIDGGGGNDSVNGGTGEDTLHGGEGADSVDGGADNDSIHGGTGADTLIGGDGDDTLHGDGDNDILSGHLGDDAMHGGDGTDGLYGGVGDDYYDGGGGDDHFFMDPNAGGGRDFQAGDTDRDVVRFETGAGRDTAYDFHGEDDFIYIGSLPESDIIATQTGANTWVLTMAGNTGDSLTLNFASGTAPDSEGDLRNQLVTKDEYTPPQNGNPAQWHMACFSGKARILTPYGLRPIHSLSMGDLVMTADHGPEPILAVLNSRISPAILRAHACLRPVMIEAGAFGGQLPLRRLHVSRQHAFACANGATLIRAVHLTGTQAQIRIQNNRPNAVSYIHLLLRRHELLNVEGVWTESYFANPANSDAPGRRAAGQDQINFTHPKRCRPLLRRADLRRNPGLLHSIGRLPDQSAPSTRPAVVTASAPAGVSP